jgi:hypothetical protein
LIHFEERFFFLLDGAQRSYMQDESTPWSPEEEIRQLAVHGGEKEKRKKS